MFLQLQFYLALGFKEISFEKITIRKTQIEPSVKEDGIIMRLEISTN